MDDEHPVNMNAEDEAEHFHYTLVQLASQFLPRSEFKLESLTLFDRKDDLQTLSKYLESVWWKIEIAHYHTSRGLAAISNVIPDSQSDKRTAAFAMHVSLMSGHDEGEPMAFAQLETEAHTIAAAQALHSVVDILSQAMYLAFRLDLANPMPERQRTTGSVISTLEKSGLKTVSGALKDLVNSETFRYLAAFVNTTKHRSLIDSHFRLSFEDPEDFGFSISAFRFEDRGGAVEIWPSKTVKEFLNDTESFISAAVDAILKTSESLLASFAGSRPARFWFKRDEACTPELQKRIQWLSKESEIVSTDMRSYCSWTRTTTGLLTSLIFQGFRRLARHLRRRSKSSM